MAQVGVIQLKPFCLVVRKRDALCSWVGVTGPGESGMAAGTLLSRESPAEQRASWIIREPAPTTMRTSPSKPAGSLQLLDSLFCE